MQDCLHAINHCIICLDFFLFFFLENKAVGVMKVGHTFTIEPMISEGNFNSITFSLSPPSAH